MLLAEFLNSAIAAYAAMASWCLTPESQRHFQWVYISAG